MNNKSYIAENIKSIIAEKGYKQKKIAQLSGIKEKQFSDMLNNRKLILAEYICPIAKALDCSPNDLLNFDHLKKPTG